MRRAHSTACVTVHHRRTFKYLQGILHGCWVVGGQWVADSVAHGAIPPEAAYEVAGDCVGFSGGPCAGRLAGKGRGGVLLAGWVVWVVGEASGRADVERLASSAGAAVLSRTYTGVRGRGVVLHHDGTSGVTRAARHGWNRWFEEAGCWTARVSGWAAGRRARGGQQVADG